MMHAALARWIAMEILWKKYSLERLSSLHSINFDAILLAKFRASFDQVPMVVALVVKNVVAFFNFLVFFVLPSWCRFSQSSSFNCWRTHVWICKGVSASRVPHKAFPVWPWYQCQAVSTFSVAAEHFWWFYGRWDVEASLNYIDIALTFLTKFISKLNHEQYTNESFLFLLNFKC